MYGVKVFLLLLCFQSMDSPPQRWLLRFSCCLQWAEPPSVPSCGGHALPPEPLAWWCLQSPELPTEYLEREEIVTVTVADYYRSALVSPTLSGFSEVSSKKISSVLQWLDLFVYQLLALIMVPNRLFKPYLVTSSSYIIPCFLLLLILVCCIYNIGVSYI